MFDPMTNTWALLALLTALGFRHGLDPDHIAAVDGMTRARHQQPAYWSARYTGLQFAFGHSLMILLAALVFHWQAVQLPLWLDDVGNWVSVSFLLALAILNLHHCLSRTSAPHQHSVSPAQQLVARLLGRFAHPVGVGFVFAISFDSLTQAALMATQGNALGGVGMILAMTLLFGLGMMLADTTNGLIMHWLVTRCELLARNAGRVISGLIAALSLLVISAGVGRKHLAGLEQAWDNWGAWIGVSITGTVLLAYLLMRRLTARHAGNPSVASEVIQLVGRR